MRLHAAAGASGGRAATAPTATSSRRTASPTSTPACGSARAWPRTRCSWTAATLRTDRTVRQHPPRTTRSRIASSATSSPTSTTVSASRMTTTRSCRNRFRGSDATDQAILVGTLSLHVGAGAAGERHDDLRQRVTDPRQRVAIRLIHGHDATTFERNARAGRLATLAPGAQPTINFHLFVKQICRRPDAGRIRPRGRTSARPSGDPRPSFGVRRRSRQGDTCAIFVPDRAAFGVFACRRQFCRTRHHLQNAPPSSRVNLRRFRRNRTMRRRCIPCDHAPRRGARAGLPSSAGAQATRRRTSVCDNFDACTAPSYVVRQRRLHDHAVEATRRRRAAEQASYVRTDLLAGCGRTAAARPEPPVRTTPTAGATAPDRRPARRATRTLARPA